MLLNIQNKFKEQFLTNTAILVLIGSIIPFIALSFYCHPSVDDFWLTNIAIEKGSWAAQQEIRESWSGRYTSMFAGSFNPLVYGSLNGYRILAVLMFIAFISATYFFVHSFFSMYNIAHKTKWLFALIIVVMYLAFMPVVAEVFYWMSGSLTYQLANILMLAFWGILIRKEYSQNKTKGLNALSILLCVLIIGCNETAMAFTTYLIAIIFLLKLGVNRQLNKFYLLLLIISLAAAYVVFSAPGNNIRSIEFPQQGQLLYSLKFAVAVAINNSLNWLIISPIIIFTILFIPFCSKLTNSPESKIHPTLLWLAFFMGIAACFFVAYWSKADHAPPRMQDTIFLIFITGWFANIFYSTRYVMQKGLIIQGLPQYVFYFLVLAASLWFFKNKQSHILTAYKDLFSGQASRYDAEMHARYNYLKTNPCKVCHIDSVKNRPETIFFEEVDPDTSNWRNKVTARYFGKKALIVD